MSRNSTLFDDLFDPPVAVRTTQTRGPGPGGSLPLTDKMLRTWSSGDLFGLTQNAGMGWDARRAIGDQYLLLSTQGGMRSEDGTPIALGYHTGHWEVGMLTKAAAEVISDSGAVPFAAYVSDPCDGRTQGTKGMFDSLPYRNDAAIVMRRLIRSLPRAKGVLGIATCDKGLPAMMLALAGIGRLPAVVMPGGVTLPPIEGEDAGKVQTIGARYSHGEISLEEAALAGCRACGSPGGGCQFLGTAATAQVVAEALGMTVPHAALAPSGQALWLDLARQSAKALRQMHQQAITMASLLTEDSFHNALLVHAAVGGSTNLLLHIPAIAAAAKLPRPTAADFAAANAAIHRFVDVLPNGPVGHPTVRMYLAGGVPEVAWHLRAAGLLRTQARTVSGMTWDEVLDRWQDSPRRDHFRRLLRDQEGIDPDDVIMPPTLAQQRGLTSTVCFPRGNLCPEGSVIKATSIDPSVVDADGVYRKRGPARVFVSERDAIAAVKGQTGAPIRPGDILVLMGRGPLGCGMEETYQITSALKYLPDGKHVAVVTDARFSGVSTGACIGHVGPEALAGGPIGKLREGDLVEIEVDTVGLRGQVNLVGTADGPLEPSAAALLLQQRDMHPEVKMDPDVPDDTRLWAALQQVGGGTWGGCVYDVDRIIQTLQAGHLALQQQQERD